MKTAKRAFESSVVHTLLYMITSHDPMNVIGLQQQIQINLINNIKYNNKSIPIMNASNTWVNETHDWSN